MDKKDKKYEYIAWPVTIPIIYSPRYFADRTGSPEDIEFEEKNAKEAKAIARRLYKK